MSDMRDLYQELILDHYKRPRNAGRIEQPDGRADGNNPLCGDKLTVSLKLDGDIVADVRFDGIGCAISTASASLMTEAVKGKTLDEAGAIFRKFHALVTDESADASEGPELGKLKALLGVRDYPARVKCATLAWHTFEAAVAHREGVVTTE